MNKKLNSALVNRSSEHGFAMPIALGLGLIMLLLGATMIIRSQGDQVTASAQKATARSLGIAETGITRVQSLLNKYGILSNITLSNTGTTPASSSWKQVYQNSTPATCSGAGGSTTEVDGYLLNEWINLDGGSKFRVTEYTYRPTRFAPAQITADFTIPASSSATLNILPADYLTDGASINGQIKDIKGTLSRSGSTYTFTRLSSGTTTDINALSTFIADSAAKVTGSVTIPASGSVILTISPANYLVDGTSVEGQIGGIRGNLSRSGSIYTFTRLVTGTAITLTGDFYPTATPGTGTLKVEGQIGANSTAISHLQVSIPVQSGNIDSYPVPGVFLNSGGTGNNTIQGNVLLRDCSTSLGSIKVTGTDPDTGQPFKVLHTNLTFPSLPAKPSLPLAHNLGTLNTSAKDHLTFPRPGDTANANGVYEYSVSSINLHNSSSITITPGQKVTFYLDGSIVKGGDIIHNCTSTPGCKPTDFKIFGYGSTGSQICMNGNNYIEAFIFAPNYEAGVAGSGGSAGGIKGSVWVNNWSNGGGCGSNTSNIVVEQTASWTDIGLTPQNLPPKIAPITSWQRQEAS